MRELERLRRGKVFLPVFLFLLFAFNPVLLLGQNVLVSGTVKDANTAQPVAGASVMVKGATTGTATNEQGAFSIAASENATLIVSAVGYAQLEISAGADLSNIQLYSVQQDMEQIVVVGYGTQKKTTLTGSVAVVDAKNLQDKGPLASPLQALQGQVPGAIVTRGSGAAGDESWAIKLRGAVSTKSVEPLVIIDGVAYDSFRELRLLNPSDIESMSFLKDAAAAIYGSRAAGGVILVTTKKGKAGKARVELNTSYTHKKQVCNLV
ncbi:MAG TPA: TonB-dependent receptor plug domain-containing protein [Niabella sp.]|nr:TonB-dependent receptor plug domain-containing protein [Niabella sp.]